jgi:hypothetical protein
LCQFLKPYPGPVMTPASQQVYQCLSSTLLTTPMPTPHPATPQLTLVSAGTQRQPQACAVSSSWWGACWPCNSSLSPQTEAKCSTVQAHSCPRQSCHMAPGTSGLQIPAQTGSCLGLDVCS